MCSIDVDLIYSMQLAANILVDGGKVVWIGKSERGLRLGNSLNLYCLE